MELCRLEAEGEGGGRWVTWPCFGGGLQCCANVGALVILRSLVPPSEVCAALIRKRHSCKGSSGLDCREALITILIRRSQPMLPAACARYPKGMRRIVPRDCSCILCFATPFAAVQVNLFPPRTLMRRPCKNRPLIALVRCQF